MDIDEYIEREADKALRHSALLVVQDMIRDHNSLVREINAWRKFYDEQMLRAKFPTNSSRYEERVYAKHARQYIGGMEEALQGMDDLHARLEAVVALLGLSIDDVLRAAGK